MKRQELLNFLESQPTIQEVKALAKKLGLKIKKRMKKNEVYRMLKDYALQLQEPVQNVQSPAAEKIEDLPSSYGSDRLMLLAVNPHLVHLSWDLSNETRRKLSETGNVVVRLYDVTYIVFNGTNAHRIFEAGVDLGNCRNYYFHVPCANADYIAEIGYKTDETFIPVLRSNLCRTPSDSPATTSRQRWIIKGKKQVVTLGETLIQQIERINIFSPTQAASGGERR
ncbi:DUF4912 domain-containing protein [Pseudothermotoga sp. U03pept]|uniref:DUF4912 domain-containing protein n=1 Tax=Pseudothermotoga sp. U03pept TaxID=3447012 RepID=UPI003F0C767A